MRELTERTEELKEAMQELTHRVETLEENEKTLREIVETLVNPEEAAEKNRNCRAEARAGPATAQQGLGRRRFQIRMLFGHDVAATGAERRVVLVLADVFRVFPATLAFFADGFFDRDADVRDVGKRKFANTLLQNFYA